MRRSTPTVLVLLVALLLPASASAARKDIFRECEAGVIGPNHSATELSDALRNIPTDADEYSDCRDLIRRARLAAAGGGGGSGDAANGDAGAGSAAGPGGTTPGGGGAATAAGLLETASPAEKTAVTNAIASGGGRAVDVGGRPVSPDISGLSPAGAANVVPTPLIVALTLLGLGLLAAGIHTIRSFVHARRTPAH